MLYIGERKTSIKPEYVHPTGWFYRYEIIELKEVDYKLLFESKEPEILLLSFFCKIPDEIREEVVKQIMGKLRIFVGSKTFIKSL